MLRTTVIRLAAIALATVATAVDATAEKKLVVPIQRSGLFRGAMSGREIVIGPLTGECAAEFAALLSTDFIAHGLTVASGAPTGAIQIAITVTRCEAHPREPMFGPGLPAIHISRTEGRFEASIRAVDLATGSDVGAGPVRGEAHKQNEALTGHPEYPSATEVRQMALVQALGDARRLYVPWTDRRQIVLMDNKECNLRQAYDFAKNGAFAELLRQSRESLDACRSNPKMAGSAWYNLAVASMLAGKHDDALSAFGEAEKAHGPKAPPELIEICRNEKTVALTRAPLPAEPPKVDPSQTGIILTNDLVLKMIEGNIEEAEIVKMIETQPCRFSVGIEDLEKLRRAGAGDPILGAMRKK